MVFAPDWHIARGVHENAKFTLREENKDPVRCMFAKGIEPTVADH
jgi:hypothetical protein